MTFASAIDLNSCFVERLNQLRSVLGREEMIAQANDLQQFYRQDWWHTLTEIEPDNHQSQWNSAMTEIHRHMRLLSVEVSFARSARSLTTRQQRLAQIDQRLQQIQGFVQVLLASISDKSMLNESG